MRVSSTTMAMDMIVAASAAFRSPCAKAVDRLSRGRSACVVSVKPPEGYCVSAMSPPVNEGESNLTRPSADSRSRRPRPANHECRASAAGN